MQHNFRLQKNAILAGLGLLLFADIALGVYNWRAVSSSSTPQQALDRQTMQMKLLKKDIKDAQEIREKFPAIQKGFDQFEASLPAVNKGYSSVDAELGAIARKASVTLTNVRFHQKDISARNLSEIEIEATVSGDYTSVVHFLNGLQRSDNVYAVENLALASDTQNAGVVGPLRVNLHMKTYFRAA
jgi:type IV pilus assembly protein PilO